MAYVSFGEELRDARERQGLDVATVARELRLRPDIIRALEDGDFTRIPQDGYARNMVKAYARMLGLNSSEIVRLYEIEANGGGSGRSRSLSASSGQANRRGRNSLKGTRRGTGQYTNFYSGPQNTNPIIQHLPLIIACAVILVLLIVVLILAFGSRTNTGTSTGDTPKVQITGVSDPTSTGEVTSSDSEAETEAKQAVVVPSSVEVTYSIKSSTYDQLSISITQDGTTTDQLATLPATGEATVTGTWSLGCWDASAVKVTVDGEEIEQTGTSSSGMPLWEVNFADYLAKWNEEHPGAMTSTSSAASSTSDATTSTGSNNSTNTTATQSSSTSTGTNTSTSTNNSAASNSGTTASTTNTTGATN